MTKVEKLELKDEKLNVLLKYPNAFFTAFYDPVLERTLLLNFVSSINFA